MIYIRCMNNRLTITLLLAALLTGGNVSAQGVKVKGNVYGGGNAADVLTNSTVNITAGQVGEGPVDNDHGNVFGGGKGQATIVQGNVIVNIGKDTDGSYSGTGTVLGSVYGGSALGAVNASRNGNTLEYNSPATTQVNILQGSINGSVYGGGLGQTSPSDIVANSFGDVSITMQGGTVTQGVYGGSNVNGVLINNTTVTINGGTVGTQRAQNDPVANIVFGGGYGQPTIVYGNVEVNIGTYANSATTGNATIHGNVYGGSAKGKVNGTTASNNNHTTLVNLNSGTVNGDVYGGGLGDISNLDEQNPGYFAPIPADVYGTVNVTTRGGTADNVFGGNNVYGSPQQTISVNINGTADTNPYAIGNVYGGGNQAAYSGTITVAMTAGKVNNIFGGGLGSTAAVTGSTSVTLSGGNVVTDIYGGGSLAAVNGSTSVTLALNGTGTVGHDVYGGGSLANVTGAVTVALNGGTVSGDAYGGGALAQTNTAYDANDNTAQTYVTNVSLGGATVTGSVYGGGKGQLTPSAIAANVNGPVTVTGTGGSAGNVYGCNNINGAPQTTVAVNISGTATPQSGYAIGNVFGGGNQANYTGTPTVSITGGSFVGSVFGGGNEATVQATNVTINTTANTNNQTNSEIGTVYGGGNQAGINTTTLVTVSGGYISTGVYGGCNTSGTVAGAVTVNINGGTIGTDATHIAYVHGGGYGSSTATDDNVTVTIGDGTTTPVIWGDVYGGSGFGNVNDAVGELTKVWLKSGTINGSLYGGGLGDANNAALVNGAVQVIVDGGEVKTTTNTSRTTGNVFGCNNVNGTPKGTVEVTINSTAATTLDNNNNKVYALQGVYGGGNLAHYDPTTPSTYPTVTINGCGSSIKDVFGGGNAAAVPYTNVTINGGDIDRVFAGGNGESGTAANVGYKSTTLANNYGAGTANVLITDGTINQVFAGSNANGTIRGGGIINVERGATECGLHIGEIYGGGNLAAGNVGTINIGCTGAQGEGIGDLYGGANQADIGTEQNPSNISLNITGGSIGRVFGGNNTSGTIYGTITVNVEWDNSNCYKYLGDVFGGGNLAAYSGTPTVNIKKGTVSGNVYGGGNGDPTDQTQVPGSTGAPTVTIGDLAQGHESYQAIVLGDVYGGGNAAKINGTTAPTVLVQKCNTEVGYVYGGGNAADVPATNVRIDGGIISHDVFGGGHGDKSSLGQGHSDKAANVGGNVTLLVTGGTIDRVFAGSNANGAITGTAGVTVQKEATSCDLHITELYGGGNMADGNAGTINIVRTGGQGEGIGSVYGGANQANIGTAQTASNITLNVTGGSIDNVFGGNNTSGSIYGTIQVNVNITNQTGINHLGNVFGGGNLAQYTSPNDNNGQPTYPRVNILKGTVSGNVYGGGKGLASDHTKGQVTGNPVVTIGDLTSGHENYVATVTGDVYGGGDAGNVIGTPAVIVVNKCNTSVGYVYGGGNAADVSGTNVTIDGGTIQHDVFGGGHGDKASLNVGGVTGHSDKIANVNGNSSVTITGGTIDRVFAGSNINGTISGTSNTLEINKSATAACDLIIREVYGGGNMANGNATAISIGNTGTLVEGTSGHAAHPENIGTTLEGIGAVYGGANAANIGTSSSNSNITLSINSGMVANVFGGNNTNGDIYGTIQVNINKDDTKSYGWYIGNVYGAGNQAPYGGENDNKGNYPVVTVTNGTVSGNVFGGGLGETARVYGNPQVTLTGGTVTGKVFGGGEAAPVSGNPTLTASGANATAARLYGGGLGSTAVVTGNNTVAVSNGTYGYVFGGGEAANQTGNVTVNISGGTITEDVYGGGALAHTNTANLNDQTGVITSNTNTTTVNLTGGTMKNVYGGGLGDASTEALVYGNVAVNLNQGVAAISKGAVVTDHLFGCNNINGSPKGTVTVYVYATQNSSTNDIGSKNSSYDVAAVYGGGNMAAYKPYTAATATNVIIEGCGLTSIEYVYGGGNAAPVPATNVDILGSYKLGDVFGGGNGKDKIIINGVLTDNPGADVGIYKVDAATWTATAEGLRYTDDSPNNDKGDDKYIYYGSIDGASIIGTTHVTLYGGNINNLFGGSNTKGDIVKESKVILGDEDLKTCEFDVTDVYGGSNEAYMSGTSSINMNCTDGMGEIFGGSRMADVHQDVVLTITGGHYRKVFGGNNLSGRIYGSITINIEQTGCLPIEIEELYGGGNQAPYSVFGYDGFETGEDGIDRPVPRTTAQQGVTPCHDPVINIVSCKSIGTVYGGGYQAKMVGSPTINVNMVKGWTDGHYKGKNDQNGVLDQTDPHYEFVGEEGKKSFTEIGVIGTIFGGGNEAEVVGDTHVNIGTQSSVTVHNVSKDVYTKITQNNARPDITDPGFNAYDDDDVTKDLTIDVEGVKITGNVYGGGNNANVTGKTNVQIGQE